MKFTIYTLNVGGYEKYDETGDMAEAFSLACKVITTGDDLRGLEAAIHINEQAFITVRREGAKELLRVLSGTLTEW